MFGHFKKSASILTDRDKWSAMTDDRPLFAALYLESQIGHRDRINEIILDLYTVLIRILKCKSDILKASI